MHATNSHCIHTDLYTYIHINMYVYTYTLLCAIGVGVQIYMHVCLRLDLCQCIPLYCTHVVVVNVHVRAWFVCGSQKFCTTSTSVWHFIQIASTCRTKHWLYTPQGSSKECFIFSRILKESQKQVLNLQGYQSPQQQLVEVTKIQSEQY